MKGTAGLLTVPDEQPYAIMDFIVTGGKIAEIDILADLAGLSAST